MFGRNKVFIFLAFFVTCGCQQQIDSSKVEPAARNTITRQISANGDSERVALSDLALIRQGQGKFVGSAKVKIDDRLVDLPFSVIAEVADNEKLNIITKFDYKLVTEQVFLNDVQRMKSEMKLLQVKKDELRSYFLSLQKRDTSYVFDKKFKNYFPNSLRTRLSDFSEKLGVGSLEPVDGGYFASGCRQHECGMSEAAWFLSDDGRKAVAVEMIWEDMLGSAGFAIHGSTFAGLPTPLRVWGEERGMSDYNSARQD